MDNRELDARLDARGMRLELEFKFELHVGSGGGVEYIEHRFRRDRLPE